MLRIQSIVVAVVAVLLLSSDVADAKLFQRRVNRSPRIGGGSGYQSFPPGTPPANCVGGQCQMQLVPQSTAATAQVTSSPATIQQVIPDQPSQPLQAVAAESSIMVTPSIASAEAQLVAAEESLARAKATLAAAHRQAEYEAARQAIALKAEIDQLRLEQDRKLEDLTRQLQALTTKSGGDPPQQAE